MGENLSVGNTVLKTGGQPTSQNGRAVTALGDSITDGTGCSVPANCYINLLATSQGWALTNLGVGGYTANDVAKVAYGLTPSATSIYTILVGQNDPIVSGTSCGLSSNTNICSLGYYHVLEAIYAWLLTPNKTLGSSLTKTGTWTTSSLNTFGIVSSTNSSTASSTAFGNTVYVGLYAPSTTSTATVQVTVDGIVYNQVWAPNSLFTAGITGNATAPWLIRIPSLKYSTHSVTVTLLAANSSSIEVDYIAGNAGQDTANGPYLYVGTPYVANNTAANYEYRWRAINEAVRQLSSDGLNVVAADVAGFCTTQTGSNLCNGYDGVHPNDAGHAIIAAAFLGSMTAFTVPQVSQGAKQQASTGYISMFTPSSTANSNLGFFVPTQRITFDNATILLASGGVAGCSVQPSIGYYTGITPQILYAAMFSVPNGTNGNVYGWNSGPLAQGMTAEPGDLVTFYSTAGTGCSNAGSNLNLEVQYHLGY